jgi:hypothetical protein
MGVVARPRLGGESPELLVDPPDEPEEPSN